MWFTRVSLRNPVFATMVMLAFVVLGLFSLQRLQIDQFPNVDFPVVVVSTEYPGAAPEIVESEVTRKIEEGVNGIAGINTLTSRSYENQSVVVIEFQLQVDGRKAAEDVREKIAALRASLRDEVEEPRVQRFDPASRPIWSVALPAANGTTALMGLFGKVWARAAEVNSDTPARVASKREAKRNAGRMGKSPLKLWVQFRTVAAPEWPR